MKDSTKIFIASLIIFACSVGFFAGAFFMNGCKMQSKCQNMCPKAAMQAPPQFKHPKEMKPDAKNFRPSPEMIDSVLQVTPEQKKALEQQRLAMDSTFNELRKQKVEAEKELRSALDSQDVERINVAKAKVLSSQQATLEARIQGASELSKILTKEQMEKFREFNSFKKHNPFQNHKSPKEHHKDFNGDSKKQFSF
ncbi:MAG: periplasmic heavy metal sensor [Fibrobacter sp.]|nr:periplasmic heavy metal sensor [Fibrobacter sp.]